MFKKFTIRYPNSKEFVRDDEIFGKGPECVGIKAFNKFCALNDPVKGIYKVYLRDEYIEYKVIIRRYSRNNLLFNEIINVETKEIQVSLIDKTGILHLCTFKTPVYNFLFL